MPERDESHIRLGVTRFTDYGIQCCVKNRILPMVFRVDAENTKADRQCPKQIVIGQTLRRSDSRIKQEVLTAGGKTTAWSVIVLRDINLKLELF